MVTLVVSVLAQAPIVGAHGVGRMDTVPLPQG